MKYVGLALILTAAVIALISIGLASEARYGDYRITGPYTHDNLAVFLIHGKDQVAAENLVTLGDALEQKKAIMHETGNVGELAIENVSDEFIFIHSGDIVKGGRQDRTIPVDVVIHPASGKLPVRSFCVERGRWSQRGDESVTEFSVSDKQLATKELKVAAKVEQSQGAVWNEVGEVYIRGGQAADFDLRQISSEMSLQRGLEHESIQEMVKPYVDAVSAEISRADDVVGFAFAINGEINSADIYRSRALFEKLSPKLVEACATEAVIMAREDSVSSNPTSEDIARWLTDAAKGDEQSQQVNEYTGLKKIESESDVIFETISAQDSTLIHLNVLKK